MIRPDIIVMPLNTPWQVHYKHPSTLFGQNTKSSAVILTLEAMSPSVFESSEYCGLFNVPEVRSLVCHSSVWLNIRMSRECITNKITSPRRNFVLPLEVLVWCVLCFILVSFILETMTAWYPDHWQFRARGKSLINKCAGFFIFVTSRLFFIFIFLFWRLLTFLLKTANVFSGDFPIGFTYSLKGF